VSFKLWVSDWMLIDSTDIFEGKWLLLIKLKD
jgi:hypothetical protein